MRDTIELGIRDLGPEELITEPGFYRISLDRHHNQPCDGYSVTSGVLRKAELGSLSDVWLNHPDNPDRKAVEDTAALRLGRVMAAFIELGPEGVEDYVRVLPSKPPSKSVPEMLADIAAGAEPPASIPNRPSFDQAHKYHHGKATPAAVKAVEYWQEIDEDPREKVNEKEWDMICSMGKVLASDPAARAALGGEPEITMAWQDERTGIWCLARPDQVSFSGMLSDYKKLSTQGAPFNAHICDARITRYGYDMQMSFAAMGFEQLTGNWPDQVGLIFQQDTAPHHVILREVCEEDLKIAEFRNYRALRQIREAMDSGYWPGPGEHVGAYRRPDWQRDMLLEQMQTAGVAP